ncbi:MAG: hypothetical protein COB77_01960 [Gammaproteobacteria bacterium]|nr:MAG: hypothetical protein COB77_01960 [Gammaproteobacteria bacterium]
MALEILFGWVASSLCTLILVPQIYKALKTKHTNDVSMSMLLLSVFGNAFWAAHAIMTQNIPLLVGASLISMMSIILIIFKYRFDTE